MSFKQSPHKLLVIPGPIEVTDEVLYANAAPSVSHISPDFIKLFGDSIRMTREVLFTKTGQPFLISGSGTLGWDQVASNLIEPGEYALVLHSGYFGDSFAECLSTYGAHVDVLKAPTGSVVDQEVLREKLKTRPYRLVAFTHVDTSTGVLSPAKLISQTVRSVSENILVVADAVCSVGSEEIKFDEWKLDVVLTASQKGLGTPPGLSILVASDRALDVFYHRRTKVTSYYASWKKWLPIMQAYEAGEAAYFATPPVNLINSYHASLLQLTRNPNLSMEERFKRHIEASTKVKNTLKELGLNQIAQKEEWAANGMTTVYYPPGVGASDIIPRFAQRGVVVAGGLLKEIKDTYFRIGHMGVTAVDEERGDLERILSALRESVQEAKASKKN